METQSDRDERAVSDDEQTHHPQSRGRVAPEERLTDAAGQRNSDERTRPRDRTDPAATEGAVAVRVLEQEVERARNRDEREAQHTDTDHEVIEGAHLLETLERRTESYRRFGFSGGGGRSEDRLLFLTAALGFAQRQRPEHGDTGRDQKCEEHESPVTVVVAGPHHDEAGEQRSDHLAERTAECFDGEDSRTHGERILIGHE